MWHYKLWFQESTSLSSEGSRSIREETGLRPKPDFSYISSLRTLNPTRPIFNTRDKYGEMYLLGNNPCFMSHHTDQSCNTLSKNEHDDKQLYPAVIKLLKLLLVFFQQAVNGCVESIPCITMQIAISDIIRSISIRRTAASEQEKDSSWRTDDTEIHPSSQRTSHAA